MQTPLITRWVDFPVYWAAGEKASAGLTVYDVAGHFQFKYSPLVALGMGKLFGLFSFETASWIFQKSMLLLWLGIFIRLGRENPWAAVGLILFFGSAVRLDLALGQLNAVVFLLLLILFFLVERKRSWQVDLLFALLFSVAVQLKLFAFVILPLLLFRREWRKLALGFFMLPLLSIGGYALAHGWELACAENARWLASLFTSTDELLASAQNVALLGTGVKALGLIAGKAVWLLIGAGFLAYLYRERARPVSWFRNRLFYAIALFNPLVWSYWILYALPLFAERAEGLKIPRYPFYRVTFFIGTIFVFIAFHSQHARWAWNGGIFGALVLLGIFDPDPLTPRKTVLRSV